MSSNRKNKNGSKTHGIIRLLIAICAIGFFAYVAAIGLGFDESGSARDIKLGLDLAGGVSITYQAKDDNPSEKDMKDTIYKLQLRAQSYSSEAEVYQEGSNRINVDIPDVTDANAILEDLGKPGSLVFKDSDGNQVLTGSDVKTAEAGIIKGDDGNTNYVVNLAFTDDAAKTFADVTEKSIGKSISIVYDDEVVSNPTVKSAITGGKCYIEGMESYEKAEELASTIRIGSLKLELEEMRSKVVGAKLGADAISTCIKAGAIGLAIVMLFMIVFYLIPGLAASLALATYVGAFVCLLSGFRVTLTLTGLAGMVLTIGMAVDANVIIFSRIREELEAGKSVRAARKDGFDKALSAILDGNITTLIAAFVLYVMGTGSVKGFATTLAIGTLLSMFTALFITRYILTGFYEIGIVDPKFYGKKEKKKEFKVINFIGQRKKVFAIASIIILCGIGSMVYHGPMKSGNILNYSLEFLGGTSTSVTFDKDYSIEELSNKVVPDISSVTGDKDIQFQKVSGTKQVIFKTKTLDVKTRQKLDDMLKNDYKVDEKQIQEESISATVSNEMRRDAIVSVILASIMMLIYIWFRFKDIRIAASTVLALLHDVLIVLTCYAVFRWSVGNTFIACMLTIVGYSINDTIVTFDRVRENMATMKRGDSLAEIINKSSTQVLSRSINTSITTGIMVIALLVFGTSAIREFALPLFVGICCGCFSSIFIAENLWYVFKKKQEKDN